jgi:PIN domain nuclease of toxin-antitoxin system
VTVLDSFAVLALLKAEPAANDVRHLIANGDATLTPLGVAEVVDHLVRLASASEEEAALDLAQLGLLDNAPVDATLGLRAGALRARHYDRRHRAVSLADCIAAETARSVDDTVATADPHLLDMCHDEGIAVHPLLDSRGDMWTP